MDSWFREIPIPRTWRVYLATGFDFRGKNRACFGSIGVPTLASVSYLVTILNRDLKQGRRRRLRKRNKFAYSVGKNNSFARPARAFHILIHFFAVLVLTTT